MLLALDMLMLMGGLGGLSFADDAEVVANALAQLLGYSFLAKKACQEVLKTMPSKGIADFLDKGESGLPGAPLDVSGRLDMGNLIPSTGLLQQKSSHTCDVLEIASRIFSGALNVAKGNVGTGALEVASTSVRNAVKGVDMAATGIFCDVNGYKVL